MHYYLLALMLDTILLLILGIVDYVKGESRLETTILVYLSGLAVYPVLPLPKIGIIILFVFHLVLLGVMIGLYWFSGGIGLMDMVIASHAPLIFPALYISTILPALLLGILGFYLHGRRARPYVCQKGTPIPGTVVGVQSWKAWDKWYFIPNDKLKNPEKADEEIREIKETIWRNKKKCVSTRFVIPLVFLYSLFHFGIILTYTLFVITGVTPV